jgi:Uma2 family endonuclease
MPIQEKLYTVEELWEIANRPENADKRLELIDGVIVEKDAGNGIEGMESGMSPSFVPSQIAMKIGHLILSYLDAHDIGYVTGSDGGYILSENTKLIPDVGYINKERLREIPSRDVPMPPDLAVEVVSPTDSIRDVQRKALKYLMYGTRMVWVVYPEDQTVDVYRPAQDGQAMIQTLDTNGLLAGDDVL